jgi:predicted nicotinamide N-methyase
MLPVRDTVSDGCIVIAGERLPTEVFNFEVASKSGDDAKRPSTRLAFEGIPLDKPCPEAQTGLNLWPGGQVLGSYILSTAGRALVKDKTVVELGCGAGLLGPVLILAGASHVVLTDCNPLALELTKLNMARNQSAIAGALAGQKMGSCSVEPLDWCQWGCGGHDLNGEAFDLIVASDVMYIPKIRRGLEQVLLGLTDRNPLCPVLLASPFRQNSFDAREVQRDWLASLSRQAPAPQIETHEASQRSMMNRSRSPRRVDSRPVPFKRESLTEVGPFDCCDESGPDGTEVWQALRSLEVSPVHGFEPQTHLFMLHRCVASIEPQSK